MNKKLYLTLLISISLTSSLSARDFFSNYFKKMDTNSDNLISKDEYISHSKKNFSRFDKDDNKIVVFDEAKDTFIAKRKPQVITMWFNKNDKNNDNKVTLDEFEKSINDLFFKTDTNKDDKLSKEEFKALKRK